MKDKKFVVSLLGNYVKEQSRLFGFLIVWAVVFFSCFALTDIPLKLVWYPALICVAIFLCYCFFDVTRYIRKHGKLCRMKKHIDVTLDKMPEPESLIEGDYQELLTELLFRKNQKINSIKASKKDILEYITLWTHQIKTPLTALQLLAAEMEEPGKAEVLMHLFEIEQYSDMMLQYIRLEGDSTDYVLKAYQVRSMVNQAVKYFSRIFISKRIMVKVEISEDMKVVTDEKWMVFVLKQLISNALKYTKKGNITISMDERKILKIEDTGIGITAEDLPRIFERGYTGYNGRKDKKATGLGLFLVKQILRQLNHGIEIISEVNAGTTVLVDLGNRAKL
ncbi:MAG: sensor histidine kinase [Lachnospiraceae bacterium]|nr:sensor histidine kinase [Lachnospiraceae bacterium]